MTPNIPIRPEAKGDRRRWAALVALCLGQLMIVLDVTIVNVALPSIQRDLGFSQANLAWVVNAYLISFGGLLLLAGRFGDLLGRKRVFLSGLVLFTVASAACGLASSQAMLVGARFVQGIGGAVTSAVILAIIATSFTDASERAKAMGVFAAVAAAGGSIGVLAGGVLTQALDWQWIFIVNVPVGIAAWVLGSRLIEEHEGIGLREGVDVPGAVLITGAVMLIVYTIVRTEEYGWGSLHTIGLGAVAVALIVAFVARQGRIANPLVPLRMFRLRMLSSTNAIGGLVVLGLFGWFFLSALYLREVLGYSALGTGIAYLPASLAIGGVSFAVAPVAVARFGGRATQVTGALLLAAGIALFTRAPVDATYAVDVLPGMLLLGIGAGLSFMPLVTMAMESVEESEAGVASGLVNTSQQIGGAIGLAALVSIATAHTNGLLAGGEPAPQALTSGFQIGFAIAAGALVVAAGLAFALLRPEAADVRAIADEALLEPEAA
jgi:EmrB/QacA subfamily drug resistance transporter